ncbi:substrate-binding domain-containing protein [Streptomyces sp. NPDC046332]|uniref:substrate-binding domain-containing protein n=1 Tax=Streptomyces sp. NPDC046332 TaxID=3155133 RepID=UPI0033EDB9C3
MAQGVLDALGPAGRRVPEDAAVGGFDDSPAALSSRPPLTTIRQPWGPHQHRDGPDAAGPHSR